MKMSFVKTKAIRCGRRLAAAAALCAALAFAAAGQTREPATGGRAGDQNRGESRARADQTRVSTAANAPRTETATGVSGAGTTEAGEAGDAFFAPIYRNFYNTYRVGPDDVLALRVALQPEYTIERAKVSPVGRVYHPLIGDFEVAGLTVGQILQRFNEDLSEFLVAPKVSVELVEANSAKIGVLGEVKSPGIVVMSRPMTVMEAVAAAGGFTDLGSRSNVTLLRPAAGRLVETKINVKRMLEGKASLEEDLTLRAGDTLIVRGNKRKKIGEITSLVGFAQFMTFLVRY